VKNKDNNSKIVIVKEFLNIIKNINKNMPILKMVYSRIGSIDKLSKRVLDGAFYDKVMELWAIKDDISKLASFDILLKKVLIKIDDDFIRSIKSINTDKLNQTHDSLLRNQYALSKINNDTDFMRKLSIIKEEHLNKIIEVSKMLSYKTLRLLNEMPTKDTINTFLNMASRLDLKQKELDKQYHNIIAMQNKLEKELDEFRVERKRLNDGLNFVKRIEKTEFSFKIENENTIYYDKENNIINVIINKASLPKGEKGEDGVGIKFDIVGLARNLYLYNSQPRGFTYLAHDVPCVYIKLNEKPNHWSRPIKLEFTKVRTDI